MLKVLHINNSFGGTTVFYNLYRGLKSRTKQTIYIPLNAKNKSRIRDILRENFKDNFEIIINERDHAILKWFFKVRLSLILNHFFENIQDIQSYDVALTGTLCKDGSIAYENWKRNKTPYVLCVRNTDINIYLKYLVFHKRYFKKVILNSKHLIFISYSYRDKLIQMFQNDKVVIEYILDNHRVIPNGTELEIKLKEKKKDDDCLKFIYAGTISPNKNIDRVFKAIKQIRSEKNINITYDIYGRGLKHRRSFPSYEKNLVKLTRNNSWFKINDSLPKEELIKLLADYDVFIMPSLKETFGLVFIESLSKGVPIIYSKDQGFDGYFFDGQVGYRAESIKIESIKLAILKLLESYDQVKEYITKKMSLKRFMWSSICDEYFNVLEDCLRTKQN